MRCLRKYRASLIALSIYAGLITALFAYILWSASSNPGDSGESAIVLLIPASPWIWLMPDSWLGPISGLLCIVFNGLIISFVAHLVATFRSRK